MTDAAALVADAAPHSPQIHLVDSGDAHHLLVPDGSRFYDVDAETFAALDRLRRGGDEDGLHATLRGLGLDAPVAIGDAPPVDPPVRALSLAVAQACNLGCSYCYADGGSFGGPATAMDERTARDAVEFLFSDVGPGERVNLSFLGGEPMLNRPVIRSATAHARELADRVGATATFSITTNGTRVEPDDAAFFEEHGFAVTVSLDGPPEVHDLLRPFRGGQASFDRVLDRIAPLLAAQRAMQVSARVTVTAVPLDLPETLDRFVAHGFHSVGFSPLLRSSSGTHELDGPGLLAVLDGMVRCGEEFERRVRRGERYPFSNAVNALRELHRGTHRPYPCGAGAGYLGVSSDGELSACHRFVGDPAGRLGSLSDGVDPTRRSLWLTERHVHRQEPCRGCWARYLCGGGCHHEVIGRGRASCDYIRGWLHWCLGAYARLGRDRPDWFGG